MENEAIILTVVAIVLFLIIKSVIDRRNDRKRIEDIINFEWGKKPGQEYSPGKLESIKNYYEKYKGKNDVDDITWNDLDMDELYMMLNHTESSMGEEVLYRMLRKPVFDKEEIKRRNSIINYYYENDQNRKNIQRQLIKVGKDSKKSFYEYLSKLDTVKKEKNTVHYIINALWLISIIGIIVDIKIFAVLLGINAFYSIVTYYKRKAQIEVYYYVLNRIMRMLYGAQSMAKCKDDIIRTEVNEINKLIKEFDEFKRSSHIVLAINGGNLSDILLDYFRILTHTDLIKFNLMYSIVMEKTDKLMRIHELIGKLDALIAIASFRQMQYENGWCVPEFVDEARYLSFEEGYHPFLDNPVYNDFSTEECILLTGSNASGKSTFLKTIAINGILAQTVVTCLAKKYKSSFFKVMTSMALSDNIFSNRSYFIVEILSIKRIIDEVNNCSVLCCIDEVLRGTNTIERIAASGEILKNIAGKKILCFAATHDTELAEILADYYSNYHFREKIVDDRVEFDYKIHKGYSQTRNAIKLLKMLEIDDSIVENAVNAAYNFEKNKQWEKL